MVGKRWWVLVGVLLGLGIACSQPPVPVPPLIQREGVEFRVIFPKAESVAVAGDFNDWSSSEHLCEHLGKGEWGVTVPLSSGEYHFMYVVNGERWVTPPLADDFIPDGFGQENGVVYVP